MTKNPSLRIKLFLRILRIFSKRLKGPTLTVEIVIIKTHIGICYLLGIPPETALVTDELKKKRLENHSIIQKLPVYDATSRPYFYLKLKLSNPSDTDTLLQDKDFVINGQPILILPEINQVHYPNKDNL